MENILENINQLAADCPENFIAYCEDDYIEELIDLSDYICKNNELKIICIAGPSGSGKTTTAHILCDMVCKKGRHTTVMSLDDFYLSVDKLPILPDGSKDIESVDSLDLELLNKCFKEIIKAGKTYIPRFDFKTKTRHLNDKLIDISSNNGIVIVEGLHALNPRIIDFVPRENVYKLYISVNSPIKYKDGDYLLSSRQIRLIRRSLRDIIFRNTDINTTLSLWKSVVEGEKKYLYCFKDTADLQLITLHPYEVCVYRDLFLQLEKDVKKDAECYEYFYKTVNALKKVYPINTHMVPKDSLIREFIGER